MNYSNYEEAHDTSRIQLDPRIAEYMRVKKFNRENNIHVVIPVEEQFGITKDDLKTIKRFKRGKEMYSRSKVNKMSHFIKPECDMSFFEGAKMEDDPRYERLRKKMNANKKAREMIANPDYEGIDKEYTIFHQTNPYDNKPRTQKISKPYDDPNANDDDYLNGVFASNDFNYNDHRYNMNSKDLVSKNGSDYMYNPNKRGNRRSESTYHNKPRIAYQQTLIPQQPNGGLKHDHSIDNIIGHLDTYGKHLDSSYSYIEDNYKYVDDTHDNMRRGARSTNTSKRGRENAYSSVPLGYGAGLADISVENSLRGGIRDSRRRTTGFKNTFEHQFDFIDEDIADPSHSVQMYPMSTRGTGKSIARPNSKAMRTQRRIEHAQNEAFVRSRNMNELSRERRTGYAAPDREYDDYVRNRRR
jgi:hypothetical protein